MARILDIGMKRIHGNRSSRPSLCIIHTGPAVPQMLLGTGPQHIGGAELQLAEIARRLCRCGWPVTFAVRGNNNAATTVTPEGIGLTSVWVGGSGLPIIRFFTRTLPSNWWAISKTNADVYLQRGIGWQTGLLAWACRRSGKRFVLWLASLADVFAGTNEHLLLRLHERWLARYGLKHADVIVAQTREQQGLLQERHGRDSVLVRNIWPVDNTDHTPPADPPEVFWAATMRELKRPHLVLDIAEALPDIRFVMAGGPAEGGAALYDQVKARAENMANVTFLGFVPFREINKYYARASAYLCTSMIEGFPNTFLQAWSHGRPVVSTFDPDELICEHDLGFHCHDSDDLVEAVRMACENSSDYAQRVRDYLRQHHSPEVIMPQIERVLLGE